MICTDQNKRIRQLLEEREAWRTQQLKLAQKTREAVRLKYRLQFIASAIALSLLLILSCVTVAAAMNGKSIQEFARDLFTKDSADVTITAVPLSEIANLAATYVDDNTVQLDWQKGSAATYVMIRAKYDSAPEDSTDGYQVYYGDGEQAYDTGCNLNETFSEIHYVAFAFDEEEVELPTSLEATMESPHMAELSTILGSWLILFLIALINALAFWQRHIFLYMLVVPLDVVYGLYTASAATSYSTTWVAGLIIVILGLFCLFRAAMKLINRE